MRRGLELTDEGSTHYADFYGPIIDLHMHPRAFDAIAPTYGGLRKLNGKAGLRAYSANALRSGISGGVAMGNESLRIYAPETEDGTELIPFPITTPDRLLSYASLVQQESLMPMGIHMCVDRDVIGLGDKEKTPRFTTKLIEEYYSSWQVKSLAAGLKIYGANTTGGYAVPLECIIPIAEVFNKHNPGKTITLHLEDGDVARVLSELPAHIPVTIAHVSSKQEMEPAIIAKENGKNVWIEVTPHHMTLTEHTADVLGPSGCMKPKLKSKEDRDYLWANKAYIDQVGSDCAPHRYQDKYDTDGKPVENPAFGVTNHNVLVPIFLEAIHEGKLTEQELYNWLVRNPHERFNIPLKDSTTRFELSPITAQQAESQAEFGLSPFADSPETPLMRGHLQYLKLAGEMMVWNAEAISQPSYDKLIRW